jgi:hypothetical protein
LYVLVHKYTSARRLLQPYYRVGGIIEFLGSTSGLLLLRGDCLPHSLGCAQFLRWSLDGFWRDYDIFEFVLGNDVDCVRICPRQNQCLGYLSFPRRTDSYYQAEDGDAGYGILD